MERLPDDLVDRHLRVLGEGLGRLDVELDLDAVRQAELIREPAYGRAKALVAKDDRLELERKVAQGANGVPLLLESRRQDALSLFSAVALHRGNDRVEHQRDPRHGLNGPVVQEEREPPALLLLGRDQLVGEPGVLGREAVDLLADLLVALPLADEERRESPRP